MSFPEEQNLNPFPWYHTMRQSHPVARDEASPFWNVFRYQDVQHVLSDHQAFSSAMMPQDQPLGNSIINIDPPYHRKLRTLVSQAFTPRTVAQLAPRITTIVHELLDAVGGQGSMDVINDLSYPLPVIVIAELLGIPTEDRQHFKHWSNVIVGVEDPGGDDAQQEMGQYFLRLLEQRRRAPQNDLLTALLAVHIEGQRLNDDELLGFCVLLLVAGNVTTTHLLGNAFLCFDEFPEALQQLYDEPALLPGAIEEVLRYRSPVRCMFRRVAADTIVGEQQMQAGQMVLAWIGSANRDEEAFAQPDLLDIRRTPNRHIAFGHGIHFCLGAPLARLEARIALEVMLERFQHIQVVNDHPLEAVSSIVLHGANHIPVTFENR